MMYNRSYRAGYTRAISMVYHRSHRAGHIRAINMVYHRSHRVGYIMLIWNRLRLFCVCFNVAGLTQAMQRKCIGPIVAGLTQAMQRNCKGGECCRLDPSDATELSSDRLVENIATREP